MRILHITEGSVGVRGGRESHVARFCHHSGALGHENFLFGDDAPPVSDVDDLMRAARPEPAHGSAAQTPVPQVLAGAPDVILLHSRGSWARAQEMSRLAPTFAWVHDQSFVCPASIAYFRNTRQPCDLPPGLYCMANAYLKFCNARRPDRNLQNYLAVRRTMSGVRHLSGVIVASQYMKRRLAIGGVPENSISILPLFMVKEEESRIPADLYTDENPNRILFVGRVTEVKGVDTLLDALALLPAQYELLVVGDGYHKAALQEHAARLGLKGERVVFAGYVSDEEEMRVLYRSAAVVAVPSLWPEPFCIVGLESLVYGKAVVGFDVGGISEWLADGHIGLLARPGDAADMAAKLLQLLQKPAYRHELGSRGPQYVRENFSWDGHWRRFESIVGHGGADNNGVNTDRAAP